MVEKISIVGSIKDEADKRVCARGLPHFFWRIGGFHSERSGGTVVIGMRCSCDSLLHFLEAAMMGIAAWEDGSIVGRGTGDAVKE
jgi:hypothetical protein